MRPFAILHFFDSMIIALVNNLFLLYFSMRYVIHQCPTNTSTASGIYETILRTGIKCIFTIYKFRMKHHITLLTFSFQVRQTLPGFQVFGTGNSCRSRCRRQISHRSCVIVPFRTENTIYPTVFMGCETHVVNISCRNNVFRHHYRIIPKTEIVNTIRTFGYGKKRFTISTFHPNHQ